MRDILCEELFLMNDIMNWLKGLGFAAADKLLIALLILVLGVLVVRVVMALIRRMLEAAKLEKAAHTLVLSMTRVALWVLLGLSLAASLGIDVTGVVALASVLTLAVSLALQNMLGNVLGGLTLLSTKPFHSGDYVELAGQSGTVEEINMTYTRLATPDNKQVSIPNSAVVAAQIVNYSASGTRRVEVKVQASYDAEPQEVIDALVLAGTVDKALTDPAPAAVVLGYGESAMDYSLRIWVKTEDYWDVFFEVNRRVHRIFREQHIQIPYPQVQIHMDK